MAVRYPNLSNVEVPQSGEIAETPVSQELVKLLECPVCNGVPFPPIYGCYNGHIICNSCRPKLSHCALCRQPYWEGRNRVIESIVNASKFQCSYKETGCTEVMTGSGIKAHLRTCKFGPAAFDPEVIDEPYFIKWIQCSNGAFPEGAIEGGQDDDGEPLLVCRAYHEGGNIPGKFIKSTGKASIPWGCAAHDKTEYEILTTVNPQLVAWVNASHGSTPPLAIEGGTAEHSGETLFIGRWNYNGNNIVGKIHPTHGCCYISYDGEELSNVFYEVLVRSINLEMDSQEDETD